MKKKMKKFVGLLLATCMLMAMFCNTAFAVTKTGSGTYNLKTYTVSLDLDRGYMESIIRYPTTIWLGHTGYAEASLGSGYEKVSCGSSGSGTSWGKTVNPNNNSLQFYHGYQTYYIESHQVHVLEANLTKL